nr:unnamed protein product [Callosobruchus analis]
MVKCDPRHGKYMACCCCTEVMWWQSISPSRPKEPFSSSISVLPGSRLASTTNYQLLSPTVIWLRRNVPCACCQTQQPSPKCRPVWTANST